MAEELFTFLSFLPAVLILYFFYKQDKNRKEPRSIIVKIFFSGFVVAILAGIFNSILIKLFFGNINAASFNVLTVLDAFKFGFIPGVVEESLKLIFVLVLVYRLKKFDERADGIFYTVTVGMGFAAIENFTYVLGLSSQGYGLQVAFMRALSAVPMHAIVGAIMGYFIGKAKFSQEGMRVPLFLMGWLSAVLIHGTYNSTLSAAAVAKSILLALIPVLLLVVGTVIAIILMRRLVKEDKMSINFSDVVQPQTFPQKQNQQVGFFCPNCGTKLVERAGFCSNCGAKVR